MLPPLPLLLAQNNQDPAAPPAPRSHDAALIEKLSSADQWLARAEQYTTEIVGTGVILLIMIVAYVLLGRGLKLLVRSSHLDPSVGVTLRTVLRWLVFILGGAAILNHWNLLENFWAAATAAVTLVAIGFVAVWSVLSNVLCSLILMGSRPFRIGDHLQLPPDDIQGTVTDISLLHTTLRSEDGHLFQIPNNMFFQRVVKRKPRAGQGKLFGVLPMDDEDDSLVEFGGKDSGVV